MKQKGKQRQKQKQTQRQTVIVNIGGKEQTKRKRTRTTGSKPKPPSPPYQPIVIQQPQYMPSFNMGDVRQLVQSELRLLEPTRPTLNQMADLRDFTNRQMEQIRVANAPIDEDVRLQHQQQEVDATSFVSSKILGDSPALVNRSPFASLNLPSSALGTPLSLDNVPFIPEEEEQPLSPKGEQLKRLDTEMRGNKIPKSPVPTSLEEAVERYRRPRIDIPQEVIEDVEEKARLVKQFEESGTVPIASSSNATSSPKPIYSTLSTRFANPDTISPFEASQVISDIIKEKGDAGIALILKAQDKARASFPKNLTNLISRNGEFNSNFLTYATTGKGSYSGREAGVRAIMKEVWKLYKQSR